MNNVSDACRTCLRVESPLTSIIARDNDSIKLCDKLLACISDIVSNPQNNVKLFYCSYFLLLGMDKRRVFHINMCKLRRKTKNSLRISNTMFTNG